MESNVHGQGRQSLNPLYQDRKTLRAVVESALEGKLGNVVADDATCPHVARIDLGCNSIFGGDANHPLAPTLVKTVNSPVELLFPDSERWRRLLHEVHENKLSHRSMTAFEADSVDLATLRKLAERDLPGYEVGPMGIAEAAQLGAHLTPHAMQVFDSPEQLIEMGFGFCATQEGQVVCQSTSYATSSRFVELAIATHPNHRKKGLARVVAARFMLHAIERGIAPHWNASNPISKRLALTLGYRPVGTCEVLYLGRSQE